MNPDRKDNSPQRIVVFQQKGSGERKVAGVRKYGDGSFTLEMVSIDDDLPPVLDDTSEFLPEDIDADLVLDYLKHGDLAADLAELCARKKIPIIASGKKKKQHVGPDTTDVLRASEAGWPWQLRQSIWDSRI